MKIQKYNAGALTNFEVLQFFRSRGASKDPSRVMVPIATSEFKVYDYLVETAACDQTEEIIDEFLKKSEPFNLAKAEILNVINVRPSTPAQIYPIIEKADERLGEEKLDELADMIAQVLPAAPGDVDLEDEEGAEEEANVDEEAAEEDKGTDEQMEEAS